MERILDPSTGEPSGEEMVVYDTPLLINIKGCGYPPEVNCDEYAEFFSNQSDLGLTFPCHYSKMNPWVVLSAYNEYVYFNSFIILTMSLLGSKSLKALKTPKTRPKRDRKVSIFNWV